MREIDPADITAAVERLFTETCRAVPAGVLEKIRAAAERETSPLGKTVLERIVSNDELAAREGVPLCQDTGVAVVFVTVGGEVLIRGDLSAAVNEGVRRAYANAYLRKSVVRHPLDRVNTGDNTPAVLHVRITEGDGFRIDVSPKGGGSENVSAVRMLVPADGEEGIKRFVLDTVREAGGKPCPPVILGIGIGGDFETCALLAKEALLRDVSDVSPDPIAARLERELLEEVNATGVGPMGFGGTQTCLAVKVNVRPCHIASLPVAVNVQCHAARHGSAEL